tara:strand:- start:253 stop:588 length:336 start_codon:yes stop_codon:yes gene_type:complete
MSYTYTSGSGEGVTNPGGSATPVARPKSYFPSTITPDVVTYYDRATSVFVKSGSGAIHFEFESGSGYDNFGSVSPSNAAAETVTLDIQPVAWSGSAADAGRVLFYYKGQSG